MNRSSLMGLVLCGLVTYFGIMHGMSMTTLFNAHALILVVGGTIAIAIFSYPLERLQEVLTFINKGFLFKKKNSDFKMIEDLILAIKTWYGTDGISIDLNRSHPFIRDSFRLLQEPGLDTNDVSHILKSRKDAVRKKYFEDAKILNNIAKYPPHLGLLGASSGMIAMMAGLGKGGIEIIGGAMAVALTATLWGIFLNNFIFLPLSDNATKAAEDEMYFREIVCESMLMLKSNMQEKVVTETVVSRLMSVERLAIKNKIAKMKENLGIQHAA
jgi:chemotaxis protein MotA